MRNSTARSAALYERAKEVMPGGNTRTTVFFKPHPIYAARGSGCMVVDVDGQEIVDFTNNFFSLIHGHAFQPVIEAVTHQVTLGTCFGLPTESEVALAEHLSTRSPLFEHFRYSNTGTEAVMSAIKVARALTGRAKVAKCEGAYHGAYDHIEVSLDPSPENWGSSETPAPIAYAKGTPEAVMTDTVVLPFNDIETSVRLIDQHADTLACVVMDAMPSRAGLIQGTEAYMQAIRAATKRHGIILILDEIVSFRLAPGGAHRRWGIEPDLITLGKIIGGGFPIGAVAGPRDMMSVFDPRPGKPAVPHGGTFSANPMTMVAGLVAMQHMTDDMYDHLERLGERARAGIAEAFQVAGVPGQVTGAGSLFRIHLTDQPITGYRSSVHDDATKDRMAVLHRYLLDHGILFTPTGSGALSTPMTEAHIDRMCETLLDGLRSLGPAAQAAE